jgi:hypothetical protein
MHVAMIGPAAEGNLKTGLFTKWDKLNSKNGNQMEKEDKHIRKKEKTQCSSRVLAPIEEFHFSSTWFTTSDMEEVTVYTVSHSGRPQS